MRPAVLVISGVAVLFFLGFLGYTFFARAHVTALAREFVVARTVEYADPLVAALEELLREPAVRTVVPRGVLQRTERELAAYHRDPHAYVSELVTDRQPARRIPLIGNQRIRRAVRWKVEVQEYFRQTFSNLLRDLRIFAGSNAIAALLAFALAVFAHGRTARRLVWIAGLLLASMAYSVYLYVDDLTFFRILLNVYVGWWYPVLLLVMFAGLYVEYHRHSNAPGDVESPVGEGVQ